MYIAKFTYIWRTPKQYTIEHSANIREKIKNLPESRVKYCCVFTARIGDKLSLQNLTMWLFKDILFTLVTLRFCDLVSFSEENLLWLGWKLRTEFIFTEKLRNFFAEFLQGCSRSFLFTLNYVFLQPLSSLLMFLEMWCTGHECLLQSRNCFIRMWVNLLEFFYQWCYIVFFYKSLHTWFCFI